MSDDLHPKIMYGVWIPKKGWLVSEVSGNFFDCYVDTVREIVEDTAKRFHGEVRYVDTSLYRLQAKLLEQEEIDAAAVLAAAAKPSWRNAWHIFRKLFSNHASRHS